MSSFFGPETPIPYCISSERSMKAGIDPMFRSNERKLNEKRKACEWSQLDYYSSMDYENKVCHAINKYLEIDCFDEILYIRASGDEDPLKNPNPDGETSYVDMYSNTAIKDWPKIFYDKYSLVKPVDVVEVSINEKFVEPTMDMLEVDRIEAELKPRFKFNFIRQQNKNKKYDKIIIKNCLKYFDKNEKCFSRFILDYFKEPLQSNDCMLIIQRVSDLNTLPFYRGINREWQLNDVKYTNFMQALQNEYYTLRYDIEIFNYLIECKSSWYRNIKDQALYPLNQDSLLVSRKTIESRKELIHGLRELNETVFKYQPIDNYLELIDRMLFVVAHHTTDRSVKLAERIKSNKEKKEYKRKDDIDVDKEIRKLYLEITPEIRPIVNSIPKFNKPSRK
jgi:hypothetical protein